jgi:hypothetical protein
LKIRYPFASFLPILDATFSICFKTNSTFCIPVEKSVLKSYNFESINSCPARFATAPVFWISQSITLSLLTVVLSNVEQILVASLVSSTFLIFRKNGFVLAEDLHASPGKHYLLKAVPFSKNITFGVQGMTLHMLEFFFGACQTWP